MKEDSTTISDKKLKPEDFLVLHFSPSKESQTISDDTVRTKVSELYFFQVVDTSEITYRPLRLKDASGDEVGVIEPGEGTDYNQLFDSDGNDILRNTNDPWRVYHYSIGVKQSGIRVYPRIPDANYGGGFSWLSGSEPDPRRGDNVGYVNSGETDYENPSTKLESFVNKQDDLTQTQFGFYVEEGEVPKKPILSIVGHGYELRPVYERSQMLELLADISRDDPMHRVRLVDYTNNSLRTHNINVPDEWLSSENTLTISDSNTSSTILEAVAPSAEDIIDREESPIDIGDE